MEDFELKYWALYADLVKKLDAPDAEETYLRLRPELTGEKRDALDYFYHTYFKEDSPQKLDENKSKADYWKSKYNISDSDFYELINNLNKINQLGFFSLEKETLKSKNQEIKNKYNIKFMDWGYLLSSLKNIKLEGNGWDGYASKYPGNWDGKPSEKFKNKSFPAVGENFPPYVANQVQQTRYKASDIFT